MQSGFVHNLRVRCKRRVDAFACVTITLIFTVCLSWSSTSFAQGGDELTNMELLGKSIFFDKRLSRPRGQSCASCHDPNAGFASPRSLVNLFGAVIPGAVSVRAGNRKPPTAAYVTPSENFSIGRFGARGGTFFDGRATGEAISADIFPDSWTAAHKEKYEEYLGPAADQAMGPFLNPVEQNLPNAAALCKRVKRARYAYLWPQVWGEPIQCSTEEAATLNHKRIAFSVAVWEASHEVMPYNSPRDNAIRDEIEKYGVATFPLDLYSAEENLGSELFHDSQNSCAGFCHLSSGGADGTDLEELFVSTSPGYFNIGFPANPFNPFYRMNRVKDNDGNVINPEGRDWRDPGLAGRTDADFSGDEGKFKVPTLRNVDNRPSPYFVKALGHNGYFKSIESVIHFYNTRDLKPVCRDRSGEVQRFVADAAAMYRDCWPEPEINSTNIFDCDGGEFCKVELAEGETFETYCDNPDNPCLLYTSDAADDLA